MISTKFVLLILCIFSLLAIRLINLNALPIFTDEAIYLAWGWKEVTVPGQLFHSLYDAKQPLLMWIFGWMQLMIDDALIAGRAVSVIFGLIAAFGLYTLASYLFSKKAGVIAFMLYMVNPYFVFYDRQALMETAVAAMGIWSVYFAYRCVDSSKKRYAVGLGIFLGIGYFIKSTFLLFLLAVIASYILLKLRGYRSAENLGKRIAVSGGVFISVISLLIIQPDYWKTLSSNSRYTLTVTEIFTVGPVQHGEKIAGNVLIMILALSPFFIALLLISVRKWKRSFLNDRRYSILLSAICIPIILQTILSRGVHERYIVSFLPLILVPLAVLILNTVMRKNVLYLILMIFGFIYSVGLSSYQLIDPLGYLYAHSRVHPYSLYDHYDPNKNLSYALPLVQSDLEKLANGRNIFVGFAVNVGNPESALLVNFRKNASITPGYFDAIMMPQNLLEFDCIQSEVPIYFVSRYDQQGGLNKFLQLEKHYPSEYKDYWVNVYSLKECKEREKPIRLSPIILEV